mmetsp:Transcript_38287/g.58356  ORF Transcript_38287/g.58356 Transcript_38287/m.58356 type:complete len:223 (+) Transcript_38287:804-1472(+)
MELDGRARLHDIGHADLYHVKDFRVLLQVDEDVAFAKVLRGEGQRLVELVELDSNDLRVRELEANGHAFDIFGEEMAVLVQELQGERDRSASRKAHCLMEVFSNKSENVSDEEVEHHNLVAVRLLFLHQESHLPVAVEGSDGCSLLSELNHGLCRKAGFRRVTLCRERHALLAVVKVEFRLPVGFNLALSIGRQQVLVSRLLRVGEVLRNGNRELLLDLNKG